MKDRIYTFDDFGLNPECNYYDNKKETTIADGKKYATETIKHNAIVFVVDRCRNTSVITINRDTKKPDCHEYSTSHYLDVDRTIKRTTDLKIIGGFMMEMTYKHDALKYGVLVENPDGTYQIVKS